MNRLTYRNEKEGNAYLNYGLDSIWSKMQRYDILNNGIQKLAEYEDFEEQGLLLKPKVALNSFVYWDSGYWGIIPYKVCNISYSIHGFCYEICAFNGDELLDDQEVVDDDFGKFVFLDKDEAEHKLSKLN